MLEILRLWRGRGNSETPPKHGPSGETPLGYGGGKEGTFKAKQVFNTVLVGRLHASEKIKPRFAGQDMQKKK